ncbi:restriction endonuclease subunit S [Ellagibacter isourolithinifaciens]|uniref:restriction endonuclease subunit S n=1 Tax=Ellagibacter isourolithinifaciens TaxID=2137581 RepID=UPI003A8E74BC
MAEKQNTPEIRFEGFIDPWEQRKLGELCSVAMCKRIFKEQTTEQGDVPFYKIGTFGGTPDAFISRELFDEYQRLYQFPKVGDILISAAGTIGRTIVYQGDPAYYQDSNIVWLQHDERLDNGFLLQFLDGKNWSSLEGSTLKRLYNKDLLNTEIAIPSPDEQHQIGSTFARLDDIITLHQRKYDKLCTVKKSMLDKMFPKPGETEPEIRFEGFTDPWEQRKLGELCTISKGHGYSKADIRDAGTPLILYGRLYTQYEARIENVDTFAVEQEGSLLSKGNEVIVPASGETAEDIAVASSVRRSGIIFGGDLNVVTPVSKLDPDYIALAITYSKAHDDLAKRAQGKSVVHVHGNDIAEVEIPYPSESEQKRISTVVLGLDSLITLHQREPRFADTG